jgi:hypothetical protein
MAQSHLDPLKPPDAKKLAGEIVESGEVVFSSHAREEMEKDELESTDCLNLLRAGCSHRLNSSGENGDIGQRRGECAWCSPSHRKRAYEW